MTLVLPTRLTTPGAEPGGGSWTMTKGVITFVSGQGGSNQCHIRCPFPDVDLSTSSPASNLRSLKINFGTATGSYDILSGKDLFDESSPHAIELLVTELNAGTHFWQAAYVSTEGTAGSYCAEQSLSSEAAWSAPGSPVSIAAVDAPFTMSASTDYQLSENLSETGTAIIFATGCTLDLNGKTVAGGTTGSVPTIDFPTSGANMRLFDSAGTKPRITSTGSGCDVLSKSGTLGTGNIVQGAELECTGLTSDLFNLNETRIFDCTLKPTGGAAPTDQSLTVTGLRNPQNVLCHGCTFPMATDDGRTYWASLEGALSGYFELWECTGTVNYKTDNTTRNGGAVAFRGHSGIRSYVHDVDITQVTENQCRHFFFDGNGTNTRLLGITADLTDSINLSTHTVFQIRDDSAPGGIAKNVHVGYATIEMGGVTAGQAALYISSDNSWSAALVNDLTVDNIAHQYGGMRVQGNATNATLYRATWNKEAGYTGRVGGYGTGPNVATTIDINEVTITGGGAEHWKGAGSSLTSHQYNINNGWVAGESSDNSRETYFVDTPQGYDMTGTPATPTSMASVSGVL